MKKDYRLIIGWFFLVIGMLIEFILFIINPNQALFESLWTHPILSALAFFFCFYGLTLCIKCIIPFCIIRKDINELNDKESKNENEEKQDKD